MSGLKQDPALRDPDAVYAALAEALDRCEGEEATAFLARLSLILANQLGDDEAVLAAIARAAEGAG
jgi:hypothetical protein